MPACQKCRNRKKSLRAITRAERAAQTLLDNLARNWVDDLEQEELVARVAGAFRRFERAVRREKEPC